jgi:hypothetical protein
MDETMSDFETVRALFEAVETCHICKGTLSLDYLEPVHCENCSRDCEEHEEPACEPIQVKFQRALAALNRLEKFSAAHEIAADARAKRIAELERENAELRLSVPLREEDIIAENAKLRDERDELKYRLQAWNDVHAEPGEEVAESGQAPPTHAMAEAGQKATVKYEGILFAGGCEYKKALLARHHIAWPSPESADKFVRDVLAEPCHCDALRTRAEAAEKALAGHEAATSAARRSQ